MVSENLHVLRKLCRAHLFSKRCSRRFALLAAAAGAVVIGSSNATLGDDVWNQSAGSFDWNTAGHWTPSGVPGAGATVDIVNADSNARTVTYDYPTATTTLGQLSISNTGNTNSLTLSTAGLVLTVSGDEFIGGNYSGTTGVGVINQSAGINQVGTFLDLGIGYTTPTDRGYYNLSGGTLNMYQVAAGPYIGEYIGVYGTGTFVQSGGLNDISNGAGTLVLAWGSVNSQGFYTLSAGTLNAGSTASINEIIGLYGTGTFVQSGGVNQFSNRIAIGQNSGSLGNYTLSGVGTLTTNSGTEVIGYSTGATGTFTQTGGLNEMSQFSLIVGNVGASGSYTLSGDGSLYAGYESVGYGGTGNFDQTGGKNAANYLTIGDNAPGDYILGGDGTLTISNAEDVGIDTTAAFVQSGGTNTITGSGNLKLGLYGLGALGTYTLNGDGTLSVGGSENVGYGATGAFVQSGGLNTFSDAINIGYLAGSLGNFTLSSVGTLTTTTGSEIIGRDAGSTGTFTQTGGLNSLDQGGLTVGYSGHGNYVLSGDGTLTIGTLASETIGQNPGSTGTFTQTGGANILNSGSLYVGDLGTGAYNLTSGLLNINSTAASAGLLLALYGTGTFTQTGGKAQLASDTNLDIGVYNGANGSYLLSGGTLSVGGGVYVGGGSVDPGGTGLLTVSNTGQLSVTGTMTVYNSGRVNLDVPSTTVGNLSITGHGIVNLNGALTIDFGSPGNDPVTSIVSYLQSGYASGKWSGTAGIISTSAAASVGLNPTYSVGYADGNDAYDLSRVSGLQPDQILIKLTVAGDANLDGTVNFEDLLIVAQNFNKTGEDWVGGNFVYNPTGLVNFADLLLVAQNFNKTIPLGLSAQLPSTVSQVPEPASTALLLASSAGYLAARRRRERIFLDGTRRS
jgi:hypothetical protein